MAGNKIKIVTHSGNFHTDDVFAVAVLLSVLDDKDVEVIRSRDEEVINSADYVVDVGGVYDSENNRFDHHQKGGAGVRDNGVPYASFGLVWKKFGEKICGNIEVSNKIDQVLVQWIDATDNGIQFIETKIKDVYPYDVGLFFNSFVPSWKETKNIDEIFMNVVGIAKTILNREITKRNDLLETYDIIEKIYNSSSDKRLIIFDRYYPSGDFISKFPEPLFVVFPQDDGTWVMKSIRDDGNSFVNRKDLPESWAGKRDSELEKITGVEGSVFCHNGRFIAVNKTKEGILKMAEIALNS